MKIPWKKKVRIRFDDESLISFIKDLLGHSWKWRYRDMFQELDIDLHISDFEDVRRNIYEWLERRT